MVTVAPDERYPGDWRVIKGLTQPELAAAAKIATTTLRGIERADISLTDANAATLASLLGIPSTSTAPLTSAPANALPEPRCESSEPSKSATRSLTRFLRQLPTFSVTRTGGTAQSTSDATKGQLGALRPHRALLNCLRYRFPADLQYGKFQHPRK